jgi:hypothetical protein
MRIAIVLITSIVVLGGCVAAAETPPAATPASAPSPPAVNATPAPSQAPSTKDVKEATDSDVKEKPAEAIPSTCSSEQPVKNVKACLPPPAFVKKLCTGSFPEVAIGMFSKGTPWTRLWLAADVDAWNASAGNFTHRAKLAFDEEVLVLSRHAAASVGGIVMTEAQASYDVLRWDGSCVSITEGELTAKPPPKAHPSPLLWGRLEETTRRALLTSSKVKTSHAALEKACVASAEKAGEVAMSSPPPPSTKPKKARGGKSGPATPVRACDKADRAFAQAVADFVRTGDVSLPTPERRP